MAQAKLDDDDDDTQVYKDHGDALTIAYQSGYYDGKKAAQPSAQEPWPDLTKRDRESYQKGHNDGVAHHKQSVKAALAQPEQRPVAQRPWVGLTTEEILDLFDSNNVYGSKWIEFARTVETKLKEKNT